MDKLVMDLFAAVGALVAAVGVLVASAKVFVDLRHQSRSKFVERCRFSKEFLSEYRSGAPMHPFVKQQGFFAIAGTDKLNVQDVEHLLRLRNSEKAIKSFVAGSRYLRLMELEGEKRIGFKRWIGRPWLRSTFIYAGVALYFVLWLVAWSPLLSLFLMQKPYLPWQMALAVAIVMVPCAIWFLKAANNLDLAEKLVATQEIDEEVAEFEQAVHVGSKAIAVKQARKVKKHL
ncbi:hypothetical protein [Comamonas testosteroni]|uniref:hypothetical protein n=1 Tax=Comamonas testosteroni TaxID=285 RepID=UPI002DBA87B6|nr:hypothetical protein [Comamonas testosteroni]MEB5967313.1 hypothetical protein [Comamonas testosteroni]